MPQGQRRRGGYDLRMRALLLATALATASLLGCGDDDEQRPAECEEISEACHEFDSGEGTAHDCHELSHEEWTREQCIAMRSTCLAACTAE
jgi:hypothetical protein